MDKSLAKSGQSGIDPIAATWRACHRQAMKVQTKLILTISVLLLCAVGTLPIWGMGPAVFLDAERTVISRTTSPDGSRSAQIERILVGGEPSIVVMVRSRWMPNWYMAGCAAASHYQDTEARVRWVANNAIAVRHSEDRLSWNVGSAPFHHRPCDNLTVSFDENFNER